MAVTEPVGAQTQRHWVDGFFHSLGRSVMPNHLTPEELSKELGIDRTEVIRVCIQEGVPIYQGKIDKFLFQAQLQAIGGTPAKH
jgi:hypothetical protein